ncbi:unnamed protein product [Leptidea sinapis]|uniref:Uncharacterized protein n=1 Tax=Leptidea sinapis TaxID=189913 RepID=A0A5E4QJP5_9NEOP|nr:unnamed protein product [Leptidea sinapis]
MEEYLSSSIENLLIKLLEDWSHPCLQLNTLATPEYVYFKQFNLSASRKQYMPILNEFLNRTSK